MYSNYPVLKLLSLEIFRTPQESVANLTNAYSPAFLSPHKKERLSYNQPFVSDRLFPNTAIFKCSHRNVICVFLANFITSSLYRKRIKVHNHFWEKNSDFSLVKQKLHLSTTVVSEAALKIRVVNY